VPPPTRSPEPTLRSGPEPSPSAPGSRSFIHALAFTSDHSPDGQTMTGRLSVVDAVRFPGTSWLRPSVLTTVADCLAGMPACLVTAPRLAVTLDIIVRSVAAPSGTHVDIVGEIVKRGRSVVAAEVTFLDGATGSLVAMAYLTFMASPRPQDGTPPVLSGMRATGSLPLPFPEYVEVEIVAPGVAEVALRPFVEQASGSLQGGVIALVAEVAAESLAGRAIVDLDTRYQSGVRIGPGRAVAAPVGEDLVRVEVRDVGHDDRLAALVIARLGVALELPAGGAARPATRGIGS